ncbi:MAG: hypothetical protein COX20_00740 [Desulfobacterales bacterium CG23_combo_of_CG06-09_8_20_14_all_52_9]|nr:MAG: hypothetical protein COX20_00740 [Desulfobacterales bacterium CG23_combo_of_CG06-09_8_20_14_all_52_9]
MLIKGESRLPNIRGSILLIQLGDIGDVVLSLPVLVALKRHFAECDIWMCVREKARGLLEHIPEIEGAISVDAAPRPTMRALDHHLQWILNLWRRRFALVLDLRTGSRGTVIACLSGAPFRIGRLDHGRQGMRKWGFTHLVQPDPDREKGQYAVKHHLNILAAVGVPPAEERPTIRILREKEAEIRAFLTKEGISQERPLVAVSPFSLWRYKEWKADGWIRLMADLVKNRGVSVVVTGSPEERERAQTLVGGMSKGIFNLAGKTRIQMLPALFKACRLYIGVDSGSLHVASAVGTPTVALFGPSSTVTWAPRGIRHLIVSKDMSCIPCRKKGCGDCGISRCLEELTISEVLKVVNRHFEHEKGIDSVEQDGSDRNRDI